MTILSSPPLGTVPAFGGARPGMHPDLSEGEGRVSFARLPARE